MVGLPGFLYDTYKQYKKDTEALIFWLAETAHEGGYVESDTFTGRKSSEASRKGKKRKNKGKEAARIDTGESSHKLEKDPTSTYLLALDQLVPRARVIVSATDPTVQIPTSIVRTIEKAVSARKRCTYFFQTRSSGEAAAETSNRNHSYFTRILEEVLEILGPRCANVAEDSGTQESEQRSGRLSEWNDVPVVAARSQIKSQRQQGAQKDSKRETRGASNRFGHLEMEEPSPEDEPELVNENEIAVETTQQDNSTLIDRRHPNANEMEPSLEEVNFAVFCLLEDLHRIRQFLRETWSKYRSHHMSLMNASITSNTAIELARRLESGFVNAFPQFSDWEKVVKGVFFKSTDFDSFDGDETVSPEWEELDYMYYFPLRKLIAVRDNDEPSVPKYGSFYDPRFDQSDCSFRAKVEQEEILMTEILDEFFFYFRIPDELQTEDELILGLRQFRNDRKVALSTCFALQIFVDIHRGLGEDVNRGFEEWKLTMRRFLAVLSIFTSRTKTLFEMEDFHSGTTEVISSLTQQWLETDALIETKKLFWGSSYLERSPPCKPHFIFSTNPLLCGVLTFACTLMMHINGLAYEQGTRTIMATAHLYNALRLGSHLEISWPDMDEMIAGQNANRVFVGSPPSTLEDCHKRFRLVQGISAQTLAPNRRKTHETRKSRKDRESQREYISAMGVDFVPVQHETKSKNGPRCLPGPPHILRVFQARYCQNELIPEVTIDHFEPLLNGRFQEQKEANPSKDKLRKKWEQTQKLSPLDLLAVLQDWLSEEELSFLIDYHTLQLDSWNFLRKAELATGGMFKKWCGRENCYYPDHKQTFLPFFLLEARIRPWSEGWAKDVFGVIREDMKRIIRRREKSRKKNRAREVISAEIVPERGPTTLWGILRPNHPTHNGVCIHIGHCERQFEKKVRDN